MGNACGENLSVIPTGCKCSDYKQIFQDLGTMELATACSLEDN